MLHAMMRGFDGVLMRGFGGVLGGLLVLALVTGTVAAPAGKPIRIGSTLALTGPLAQTALLHKIAVELSLDNIDEKVVRACIAQRKAVEIKKIF